MRCQALGILGLIAAGLLRVQAAAPTATEFPFEFRDGLLWVEVKVAESIKPLNFLLDTGAQVSVLNLSTARRLGLARAPKVRVQGVHASAMGEWPQRLAAAIGGIELPMKYLALDLSTLSQACECHVDGLVGADFFRQRIVQLDFKAQKVRLLSPTAAENTRNSLELDVRRSGMRVKVSVNGCKPKWVRLDTGCASALQWVTSAFQTVPHTARLAVGLARLSVPETTTTVELGRYRFHEVSTGLHSEPIFPGEAGLLGNGLLSRFETVTLDASSGRIILGHLRGP